MWQVTLDVESNGFVVFDLGIVKRHFGAALREGENLLREFLTSEAGDVVLHEGVIVPVLAIDDLGYDIVVRLASEAASIDDAWVVAHNRDYALRVIDHLIIADLEAINSWDEGKYGNRLQFPTGIYRVEVRGFAAPGLAKCGYEFVLEPSNSLPNVTADTGASMRVLRNPQS